MARLSFRQGIVRHQTDPVGTPTFLQKTGQHVNLVVSPDPTIITFVHGTTNYLFTENVTTLDAWGPFVPGSDVWLYWDLNRVTGVRTFGHTTFEPIEAGIAPTNPGTGQMWFNTSFSLWYEWNGSAWVEVIRVFAAKFANSTAFVSMSMDTPIFTGTQVGLTTPANVGSLMYDGEGKPIFNSNKQFFTTEDTFTTGVPTGASLKVNNVILRAQAQQPIGAYNVVVYSDFNKIIPALPFTVLNRVYGITEEGANVDDVINVVTEGIIFNEAWDWPAAGASVNAPVFIDNTGQIVLTSIGTDDLPVGAVISPQSILFDPTLYGLTSGGASSITDHSVLFNLSSDDHLQYHTNVRGDIRYYTKSVADASFAAITHTHTKSNITDFAHDHTKADITDFAHTHTESEISDLKAYLQLSGGSLTGILNLSANPVNPLEAATKAYVDSLVNGILWIDPIDEPNVAGIDINDPGTITGLGMSPDDRIFIIGSTPISLWSAFPPGALVQWNGTSWDSWDGANGTVQVGDRYGISTHPDTFPPNVDVGIVAETGKLITITDNTPGSITYDVHTPTEPQAVFVNNANSAHFGHTYSFTGTYGSGSYGTEYKWIQIVSAAASVGGTNITVGAGNIVNVSPQGIGSGLDADLWDGQQTNISGLTNKQVLRFVSGTTTWDNQFQDYLSNQAETVTITADVDNIKAVTNDFISIDHVVGGTTASGIRFLDGGTNPLNHVDIRAADTMTGSVTLRWPTSQPLAGEILSSDAAGQMDWISLNGTCIIDSDLDTFVGVSGTDLAPCTDSGTNDVLIVATGETKVTSSTLRLDSTGTAPSVLFNTDTTNYVGIKAPSSIASDITITLPDSTGTNGQVLTTDGNGITSWTTASGGISNCITDGDGDTFITAGGTLATPCVDSGDNNIIISAVDDVTISSGDDLKILSFDDVIIQSNVPDASLVSANTSRLDITALAGLVTGGRLKLKSNANLNSPSNGYIELSTDQASSPIILEVGKTTDNGTNVVAGAGYIDFRLADRQDGEDTPVFRFVGNNTPPSEVGDVTEPSEYVGLKVANTLPTDTKVTFSLPSAYGEEGWILTSATVYDHTNIVTGDNTAANNLLNEQPMEFKPNPYDIPFGRSGVIADSDIVNRIVVPRTAVISETSLGNHYGYVDVAPTGAPAVFTVFTATQATPDTLVSKGTITFAIGSRTATIISVPAFNVSNGDHVLIQATTASSCEGPHFTLAGFSVV